MKWDKKESGNFEDRRGMSGGGKAVLGGGIIGIIVLLLNMFGGETGQTIGKKKMSIKLVSLKTGAPIGIGFAIIRWLSWPVFNAFTFGLFSLVDMFFPLFDKKNQRVVDKMLTSVVIISGSSVTATSTPGSATLPPPNNDPYS